MTPEFSADRPLRSAPRAPLEDEVDRITAAWRRERPDLDVSPLEVLSRVTRLARHLDRDRAAAFAEHDLELWEFDVLAALRRSGPPYQLTPTQLISQTLVTSGTMTNRIDRMEERGLVARHPDPHDGRSVIVKLTAQGRTVVDSALVDLLAREGKLLNQLDPARRRELANLLRRLVAPFDAES